VTRHVKRDGTPSLASSGAPAPFPFHPARAGLAHACFLDDLDRDDCDFDRQALLGAFLVMRLADKLAPGAPDLPGEALEYQLRATERHLFDEVEDSPERAHLESILRAIDAGWRRKRPTLVAPSMLAYAHHLEEQLRFEQAQDVLRTLLLAGGEKLSAADTIAARLFVARIDRKQARFEDAETGYEAARQLAERAGDRRSALLSRVGCALIAKARGNLPAAETSLRQVITEAESARLRDVQARAHHDLGFVLENRGHLHDAIRHSVRAVELYQDEPSRLRALVNVGIMLRAVGAYSTAKTALSLVAGAPMAMDEVRANAAVELMEIASREGDRITFETNRERVLAKADRLPLDDRVDFLLKTGLGLCRFGQTRRGTEFVDEAATLAASGGLHEAEFRIARIRAGLHEATGACGGPDARVESGAEDLRDVTSALDRLASAAAVA
jgi:tetratricopeptide (TPR) repeat protein